MSDEEIATVEGRGKEAMEETIEEKLILSHKNLLWLKKGMFNTFTSNYQLFDSVTEGSYQDSQELLYQTLEEVYRVKDCSLMLRMVQKKLMAWSFLKWKQFYTLLIEKK